MFIGRCSKERFSLQHFLNINVVRKLKRDLQAELTEASFPGAALSIVATVVMLGLIFAEFNSFLSVQEGEFVQSFQEMFP